MKLRIATWAALLVLLAAGEAHAQQGFALDRFALAPTPEDGLALQLPSTLGPMRWSARLSLGYAREPFVSGTPSGKDVGIVNDHLAAQAAFALGLGERFEVFALVPVTLYQGGDKSAGSGLAFTAPDSAGVGDLALGGSAHLLGQREHGFQLGLNAALLLPIGSSTALASDGGVGVRGTLTAAVVLDAVTLAIEGGAAYRPKRSVGFVDSGSELLMRAGAYVPIGKQFRLLGELNSATRVGSGLMFKQITTPAEALVGGEYSLASGLRFGLNGGPGLTLATGTPLFRVFGTVGYAGPREPPAPPAQSDRDHDGFADEHDSCPDQPEDANNFEDSDGCPDATKDSDSDGVADMSDACPALAEDKDGVEDQDGCPEADPDGDKDGIRDADDRCPTQPETMNGIDDQDGCPDQAKPAIALPEPASFEKKSAGIKGDAIVKLQSVLSALRENPELRVSIEGHSSDDGNAEFNQALSEQRAAAAQAWLVQHGIAATRLEVHGFGATRPKVSGDDEAARASNRRVEFQKLP